MQQLQNVIESAFERRADITPANVDTVTREAVNQVIALLDSGALRVATRHFFCLHVLALFVQLQRDIQQQPVVKATEIQAGQLRDTVQPVLQRIAMNKQRL